MTKKNNFVIHDLHLNNTLYNSKNITRRWLHLSRYQWICDAIKRYSKKNFTILEIGVGSGIYLPILHEVSGSVFVTDIEKEYITNARIKFNYENVRYEFDDITKSKFETDLFDMILFSEVLEHIEESQICFNEIRRILKPEGILILTTPQKYSPIELLAKVLKIPGIINIMELVYNEPISSMGHINLLTEKDILKQAQNAGFLRVEKYKTGMYIPIIAEFGGIHGKNMLQYLEKKIQNTRLEWLLWSQCYVFKCVNPHR